MQLAFSLCWCMCTAVQHAHIACEVYVYNNFFVQKKKTVNGNVLMYVGSFHAMKGFFFIAFCSFSIQSKGVNCNQSGTFMLFFYFHYTYLQAIRLHVNSMKACKGLWHIDNCSRQSPIRMNFYNCFNLKHIAFQRSFR